MRDSFRTGDVMSVTGLKFSILDKWASEGVLGPVEGGGGRGSPRRLTFSQALAVAVGAAFRRAGATPVHAENVVRFVAGAKVDQLLAECAVGRTYPVPAVKVRRVWLPGLMTAPPPSRGSTAEVFRRLDLGEVYANLRIELTEFEEMMTAAGRR